MRDIENSSDINTLVRHFYSSAISNEEIGHFFTKVIPIDFATHIPRICSFWESILLGNGAYKGNPMEAHIKLNQMSFISDQHFETWLQLWNNSLDDLFIGSVADEAKNRARQIAGLMKIKIAAKN